MSPRLHCCGLSCPPVPVASALCVTSPLPLHIHTHSRDAAVALSRNQELETPGVSPVPPWVQSQTGEEGIRRSPVGRGKASYQVQSQNCFLPANTSRTTFFLNARKKRLDAFCSSQAPCSAQAPAVQTYVHASPLVLGSSSPSRGPDPHSTTHLHFCVSSA